MRRTSNRLPTVGLVVFPLKNVEEECGQMFVGQFIDILAPLAREVIVISGNYSREEIPGNVRIVNADVPVITSNQESLISRTRRLIGAQVALSRKLVAVSKELDIVVILQMTGPVLLPTLVGRIQRKKVIVTLGGSLSQSIRAQLNPPWSWIVSRAMSLIEQGNYILANKVTVGSSRMTEAMGLGKHREKVFDDAVFSYLNTQYFDIKRSLSDRENVVGYVGRLWAEKGNLELVDAIPLVVAEREDVRFLIVGDGPLRGEMVRRLEVAGCLNKVDFAGWVPHENIPQYLNEMKIHVLPSYTEALGGSNLEAMACGAISVVNSVGGLPDVVIDGKSGFLLKDNSPHTVARKIGEILSRSDLDQVQRDARTFVEENFSYERVSERWSRVLSSLA